jgi:hypothetical protein
VSRSVCPAYAHAFRSNFSIVKGKRSMVPTVSPTSVREWAHWPIRKLSAQIRLRKTKRRSRATATPKESECMKPTPGQPRWNSAGSSAPTSTPKALMPYTNHLVARSGE